MRPSEPSALTAPPLSIVHLPQNLNAALNLWFNGRIRCIQQCQMSASLIIAYHNTVGNTCVFLVAVQRTLSAKGSHNVHDKVIKFISGNRASILQDICNSIRSWHIGKLEWGVSPWLAITTGAIIQLFTNFPPIRFRRTLTDDTVTRRAQPIGSWMFV